MPSIKNITIPTGTSVAVKTIINNRKYNDKKQLTSSVPTTETLAELYGSKLPGRSKSFDSFLRDLHKQAESNVDAANSILRRAGEPTINLPTGASFNNCNGKWTEYGYAAYAWNCLAKINDANRKENDSNHEVFVYVKLPNRNSDTNEWSQLLVPDITKKLAAYPTEHSKKITNKTNPNYGRRFELISSNPDSVILKYKVAVIKNVFDSKGLDISRLYTEIDKLDQDNLDFLDGLFDVMKHTVLPSRNLQCFLSIKRSSRPDRRYQWVHEGDHVKTILQWIYANGLDNDLKPDTLNGKFFAVSLSEVSQADKDALNTGLAGSIISPMLDPIWAVDKLMQCTKFSLIESQIKEMLKF